MLSAPKEYGHCSCNKMEVVTNPQILSAHATREYRVQDMTSGTERLQHAPCHQRMGSTS